MKWLVIYRDKEVESPDNIAEMLRIRKNNPTVQSVAEFSGLKSPETINAVKDFTHCIILDNELLTEDSASFIYGYIAGTGKKIYALKNEWTLKLSKFCELELFNSSEELCSHIKNNYEAIRKEHVKKCAWATLFHDGVPFTTDCFAFHIAKDNRAICQLFLDAGMDINARDGDGTPMLNIAVRNEQYDCINWILSMKNIDIDAVSKDRGYSAVMDAVWKSDLSTVKLLVERKANLNFVSNDKQSALVLAVGAGKIDICKILVENGADPDIKDAMGMSAYEYAVLFKRNDIAEILQKYHKA